MNLTYRVKFSDDTVEVYYDFNLADLIDVLHAEQTEQRYVILIDPIFNQ